MLEVKILRQDFIIMSHEKIQPIVIHKSQVIENTKELKKSRQADRRNCKK